MLNNQILNEVIKPQAFEVKRGDIFYAKLPDYKKGESSIQGGLRPFIILQNDIGNKYSPTVFGIPATSQLKKIMPTHTQLGEVEGLDKVTYCIAEQAQTIDKRQLRSKVSNVTEEEMLKIEKCLLIEAGIDINKHIEKVFINEIEIRNNIKEKIEAIEKLDNCLIKFGIYNMQDVYEARAMMIKSLKNYCDECKIDINKFYNIHERNINLFRGEKVNERATM